jgi:hypothetical protein
MAMPHEYVLSLVDFNENRLETTVSSWKSYLYCAFLRSGLRYGGYGQSVHGKFWQSTINHGQYMPDLNLTDVHSKFMLLKAYFCNKCLPALAQHQQELFVFPSHNI